MSYKIIQMYISKNRSGQALTPIGAVVHGTDTPGATAANEQSYFNNNSVSTSAHAFIDWTSIIETVPDDEVAWGSGYTSNHKFLQIELCEPPAYDLSKFTEVWNRAVWYFAYKFVNVLKINTVTKDNLMSHAEVSAKWKETDHQDPVAYFSKYGKTVDDFRADVQLQINIMINPVKEGNEVKNLVVYGNSIDKRAAEYLADSLQCATLDGSIPFDYSKIENVICVGSAPPNGWTSYAKKIIAGSDRYDTIIQVLKYIGRV